jgi:hypothetical protein
MIISGVEGALINLKAAAVLDKDQVVKRLARASAWMAHQFSRVWNTCLKGSCRLLALRRIALGVRQSFRAMASMLIPQGSMLAALLLPQVSKEEANHSIGWIALRRFKRKAGWRQSTEKSGFTS